MMMLAALTAGRGSGDVNTREARDTLTAVEMDPGDELRFTLRSGRTVSLLLEGTDAAVLERVNPGGIVYEFSCRVRVDGQPMTLRRFVCAQECFYEPYVVAGLRIWPDTVKAVFDQYVKDWNVPDMDAVEALLDPEVVQLVQSTPDTTFVGRDALMASWRKLVSENTDVWSPTVLDVQVSGDLAYLMYSGEETITPKAGGPAQNLVGSGWEVFRRDATGSWKLVNESFFSRAK